ncbi:ROK family transcriptional regulator [Reinekea sp.]|jgi:predicted NBD/HSP70 family sugar kinase|uniref:ROK family transcriptional regulator n=1 Tax=Reinekea sp. TaxID=1970455 RepID=UPI002A815B47|nr:ROK family transcriptional regulator [Reinekea sp.]
MSSQTLKGSNLTTVRGINERLILHLIREQGELTKADTTRLTGLSPNAISVIFRSLEEDNLLLRCQPIRGRIGQPSVPMRLNPDARYYIGFKIGRRTFELALVNFTGTILAEVKDIHKYPTPENTLEFVTKSLPSLLFAAGKSSEQISAFNVAMPFELWSWSADFDAPEQEMAVWRDFDLKGELCKRTRQPVTVQNDGNAACRAELIFGPPVEARDFIYFFVGAFIGGGIVLNGGVFPGRSGNAGGFGPMRVPENAGADRLVDHASLVVLEHLVAQRDSALAASLYEEGFDWNLVEPELAVWLTRAGRSLAYAVISALAVIDFEAVMVDGGFPADICMRLVREVQIHLESLDKQGVVCPDIKAGHFNYRAGVLGAAAYQISTEFMIDQNTLLQRPPDGLIQT